MIIGIGCDIIEVERIQNAIEKNSRFCEKLYTASEIEYCSGKANSYQSFAVRFAAKEAVMKALGTGWNGEVNWIDIEVVTSEKGSPTINLTGGAKDLADKLKVNNIYLSLAHEKGYALAFVILEGE
ncbi:MAG: holo-ACP synthase [Candidatus Cloacimonas acidaminovorans]|nr:holo-ACP synthase [Candidatus Cloacimonas acidaminovorans]